MCTSFIQGIVNEFFLRNKKIEIKFEPGTRFISFIQQKIKKFKDHFHMENQNFQFNL